MLRGLTPVPEDLNRAFEILAAVLEGELPVEDTFTEPTDVGDHEVEQQEQTEGGAA